MRVLHVYKTFYPHTYGGVEQVIHQLARGMRAHGVESTVLSLRPADASAADVTDAADMQAAGYQAVSLPRLGQVASMDFAPAAFGAFNRLARQADLIHYHFPWPFMDLLHFARLFSGECKVPTFVTYHSDIVRQKRLLRLYAPLRDRFLKSVDRIIATSPNYAATSPVLQRFAGKVRVIPIGIDEASYPQANAAALAAMRARLQIPGDGRFLLFVGALRTYKGLSVLLDAMQGIDLPLVIAGHGPEGSVLQAHAHALGLRQTRFLGAVSEAEKRALLQLCHAFVFPSNLRSEAFGVSLLEAALYGKPLIATELGTGTSYINQHGETGLVVPPDDPAALRAAILQLWNDPELAMQMGAAARQRYQQLFRAETMAVAYAAEYKQLSKQG